MSGSLLETQNLPHPRPPDSDPRCFLHTIKFRKPYPITSVYLVIQNDSFSSLFFSCPKHHEGCNDGISLISSFLLELPPVPVDGFMVSKELHRLVHAPHFVLLSPSTLESWLTLARSSFKEVLSQNAQRALSKMYSLRGESGLHYLLEERSR